MEKIKIVNLLSVVALVSALVLLAPVKAFADAGFLSGDIYLAGNTTNPSAGWSDPVNANVGDIIEFQVKIFNEGVDTANGVQVKADLPTNVSGGSIASTIHIKANNASEVDDTATVNYTNDGNLHSLIYFPGHAVLDKVNGSQSLEAIGSGNWVAIPDIAPGDSNGDYLTFKATLSESKTTPSPTPTPTPTPSPTPSSSTTPSPSPSGHTITVVCANGEQVTVAAGGDVNFNEICNNNTNVNNNTNSATGGSVTLTMSGPSPAPGVQVVSQSSTPVSQLPKTGVPLAGLVLGGLVPAGIKLRRYGQHLKDLITPVDLVKERELKKFEA